MKNRNDFWFFFQFLQEVEKGLSREAEKQVMIEKAINLRLMCDYVVSCSYRDIILMICMLRDYVKMLDEYKENDIVYQAYYRKKFMEIADRLSEQIGYDYDAAVEKCKKKLQKEETSSDIGEEAVALTVKYGDRKSKDNSKKDEKACSRSEMPEKGEGGMNV